MEKTTEVEIVKIKKVLYDNLDMLFDKLEKQNQDWDELDLQLKRGGQKGKK